MSIIDVGILTGFSVKQETLVEVRGKFKSNELLFN